MSASSGYENTSIEMDPFEWGPFSWGMLDNESNVSEFSETSVEENLWQQIPIGILLTLLSLLTFVGNAMVLHAVRTERRLQTVSNMYIVSLALADLIVGIFVMPVSAIYIFTKNWIFGLALCQLWIAVDYTASTASILNLFILSVDRYWSVTSPLRYLRKRTKKRAIIMISIVWLISSLWIIPIVGWHHFAHGGTRTVPHDVCDTEYAKDSILKIITAFFNFYLPLAIMYSLYGKVFHEIRKRSALELGQQYPTTTGTITYNYINEVESQLGPSSSYSDQRADTFTDQHSIRHDDYTSAIKNSSFHPSKTVRIRKIKNNKCLVLKTNKVLLTPNGSERTRLSPRCRVEYIYDESVLDQKTEKVERFFYQENIPLTILTKDVVVNPLTIRTKDVVNPSICNEPSLSSPSSGSSGEEKGVNSNSVHSKDMKKKIKQNFSLVNGIEHIRNTETILDQTAKVSTDVDQDNNGKIRGEVLFGDIRSRRLSSMFNLKHRIKNFRQSSSLTREIKAARQLGVIMGAFTVCFLPYFTLFLVVAFCDSCVSSELMTAMTWIGYLNSTLNPALYPLCNMNFRRKFRKMLRINRKIKRNSGHGRDKNSLTMRYD